MPVYTSLRQFKRKTRNRQKWLYGYSVDSNAMSYLEGSGSMMDGEDPNDLLTLGVDFRESDTIPTEGATAAYNAYPIITNMSMNASMGNTINFSYSYLCSIMDSFSYAAEDKIIEPSEGSGPVNFGTTRYYCQAKGEPEQFTWNVSTSVVNSGCIAPTQVEGESGNRAKVRVTSFNASLTQYFEGDLPDTSESSESTVNTYTAEDGSTARAQFCTGAIFLPALTGVGTGGDDGKPLLAVWDFSVSETGTEYTTDNTAGRNFVTAECDGIPEIPTYWIEYPVIES